METYDPSSIGPSDGVLLGREETQSPGKSIFISVFHRLGFGGGESRQRLGCFLQVVIVYGYTRYTTGDVVLGD